MPVEQTKAMGSLKELFQTRHVNILYSFIGTPPKTNMGVSKNSGIPKSSILIGFSLINHPFWDTTIFRNTHMSPEKWWLEDDSVFQNGPFSGVIFVSGRVGTPDFSGYEP